MTLTLSTDTTLSDTPAAKARRFSPNDYRLDGNVAYLALTRRDGSVAAEVAIDAADLPAALGYGRWTLHVIRKKCGTTYQYARNQVNVKGQRQITYLHRLLMDAPADMHVDHISGGSGTLDCRRVNMRVLTPAENAQNQSATNSHSQTGVRNVRLVNGKYKVQIRLDGKVYWFGPYTDLAEAAAAAQRIRVALHPCYNPDRDLVPAPSALNRLSERLAEMEELDQAA